jgi:hypothetical protein
MSETEVPEGVDPETGEVIVDDDPDQDEGVEEEEVGEPNPDQAGDDAESEREAELAADQQAQAQAQQTEDAQIEKNTKALNRAAQNYIKKVVETLGPDLEGMQTCPLCAEHWPGLRFPVMPAPEHLAAVRVAIGLDPGDNLKPDPYARRCDTCDGWMRTDSGSRGSGQGSLQCWDCQGRGWVPVGDERRDGAITVSNGQTNSAGPVDIVTGRAEPPEVAALKELGYIVVDPPPPPAVPTP